MQTDPRWELMAKLQGSKNYQPITISIDPINPDLVLLSIDSRSSVDAVVKRIRQLWPELTKQGVVHRRRPMLPRAAAILEFVMFETKDKSWRERQAIWNERYPEWAFKSPLGMHAYHRRQERAF